MVSARSELESMSRNVISEKSSARVMISRRAISRENKWRALQARYRRSSRRAIRAILRHAGIHGIAGTLAAMTGRR